MTSSWTNKGNEDEKTIEGIEIRADRRGDSRGVELGGDAVVELADAGAFWLARDHVLASAGNPDFEQDFIWRVPWTSRAAGLLASPHDAALGPHDSRRA